MSSPLNFSTAIDGVARAKSIFTPQTTAQTISFNCENFPHKKQQIWRQRFQDGLIYAANGEKLTLNSPYIYKHIFYYRFLNEIHVPFEHQIFLENDDLLIVDKPLF